MSLRPELKLDWATHKAAKYACETWHYSGSVPAGASIKVGVWENGSFIGVVLFGAGSGNSTNGTKYGLNRSHDIAELTRIALTSHKTAVSRIMSIALKFLKKQSPKIRMVISFADPKQGHIGGIYQAGGWIFTGVSASDYEYNVDGRWLHHRTASAICSLKGKTKRPIPSKYRYLMPLDKAMKEQIKPLAKPYPKREKQAMDTFQVSQRRGSTDLHAPPISPI